MAFFRIEKRFGDKSGVNQTLLSNVSESTVSLFDDIFVTTIAEA